MVSKNRVQLRVASDLDVALCALEAGRVATRIGFKEKARSMIITAVSELTSNIIKYAGTGDIRMDQVWKGRRMGIEVVTRDSGPGITNIEEAMTDHFSTAGTLGLGLPGVRRLVDEFEIETAPGEGTRVLFRKWC